MSNRIVLRATVQMGSADGGDPNPVLEVRLLGGFEVRVGDRLVPASVWGQRRSAAIEELVALLAERSEEGT